MRDCASATSRPFIRRAWEEEIADHERRGLEEIERMAIEKINERTGSAADQLRQTYGLFGRPREGITPESFYGVLRKMGFVRRGEIGICRQAHPCATPA